MVLSNQLKGFLYILLADSLWGLSGTVAKYLFNQQVSPYDLVQLRLILSFILLGAYFAVVNPKLLKVQQRDYGYFLIFGIFGVATVQFTYLYAISETNVATAVFLQYLSPIFILLYGLLTRQEIITAIKLLAISSATLGGFLIVKGNFGSGLAVTIPGLIGGLASALSFAFYTIYGKYGLDRYSLWTLLLWGMGVGGIVWMFHAPPWVTFFSYSREVSVFFFYIAIFSTILPFGFFFKGLQYLSPVVTGITSSMEPVLAGIIAYIILGEVLSNLQIIGCSLVIVAVVLVQIRKEKKP